MWKSRFSLVPSCFFGDFYFLKSVEKLWKAFSKFSTEKSTYFSTSFYRVFHTVFHKNLTLDLLDKSHDLRLCVLLRLNVDLHLFN